MSGQHNLLHKLCPLSVGAGERTPSAPSPPTHTLFQFKTFQLYYVIMAFKIVTLTWLQNSHPLVLLLLLLLLLLYSTILACVCFVVSNLFNKVEQFEKWSIYYTTLIIIYSFACFHPHHSHSPVNLITIPQSNHCRWNETLLQFRSSCPDYNHSANNWIPHNTIIHPR